MVSKRQEGMRFKYAVTEVCFKSKLDTSSSEISLGGEPA